MTNPRTRTTCTTFYRKRALVWVCDIEKSSSILNDVDCINQAEEFLKRFFFLSSLLIRVTGGQVSKWTGDGFLAAYNVPLDRDLGARANQIFSAAWHLTFLINVTQLGVKCSRRFRVRHGVTYEPDAILVEHETGSSKTLDIIGRSVVLAFRLSGIKADFPGIVTSKNVVAAAAKRGSARKFCKLTFSRDDLLKHFKGEKWATNEIYASTDKTTKSKSPSSTERRIIQAIDHAEGKGHHGDEQPWFSEYIVAMFTGPKWAQEVLFELSAFADKSMLEPLKAILELLREKKAGQKSKPYTKIIQVKKG